MIKPITKENKNAWLKWINDQLDTTNNAQYTNKGINRVFLTPEDDIDIAKHILLTMKATVENL